ncbi:MAG: polysaccharide deacetylase family protein [Clostridia bacterium]|nr:polysaccharide deacetylase family protein [Clostridia bacterium]
MKHTMRILCLMMCLMLFFGTALAYPAGFLVYHGDREVNRIAITVDDIYDANVLRAMHELSVELDFPITYFVLGTQIRESDKDIWEDVIARGGEVGNHTWKHPYLTRISIHNARNQILLTQEAWDNLLGYHYPLRLLRPPFGYYKEGNVNLLDMFYEYGVEKTVMWDVSYTDPAEARKATQNGSILLFHTNYEDLECLKVLIPQLIEDGYELVTVSELLGMEPIETSEEKYVFPYR